METREYLLENKKKIMGILSFVLIVVSLSTIGWVIYRFFFWEAPLPPGALMANLSNFNLTK